MTHAEVAVPEAGRAGLAAELSLLGGLAAPSSIQGVFGYGTQIIGTIFIAQINENALSAASMATALFNVTGLSIVLGLATGVDTLCGQAYGAGEYRLVGIVIQRAMLIGMLATVPIYMLWLKAPLMLKALGQDRGLVDEACTYLLAIAPTLLFQTLAECVRRYQTIQSLVLPSAVCSAVVCVFSFLAFPALTIWLPWGLNGAALAINLCNGLLLLLLTAYTCVLHMSRSADDSRKQLWTGFQRSAWQEWMPYLRLSIPSCAMVCLEWWLFELITLMAGRLPHPRVSVAIVGVCVQIVSLVYMIPLGVSSAVTIRVSNLLGAGHPRAARRAAYLAMGMVECLLVVFLAVFVPCRHRIARVFLSGAKDGAPELAVLSDCLVLIGVGAISDWLCCVLAGIMRGAGRQELGAKINLITYWVLGPPLLWYFGFAMGWGARGLWAALALVTANQAVVMLIVVGRFNWQSEVRRSQSLVYSYSQSVLNSGDNAQSDLARQLLNTDSEDEV